MGVFGKDLRLGPPQRRAEPRKLARWNEGEPFVVRLEDRAALIELLAPVGVVLAYARVQHEIVAATRDRDRIELDRAEPAEDLEHGAGTALERSRWCEELAGNEKTARGLSGDPHAGDASARVVAVAFGLWNAKTRSW